jgi:DNA gyrase/topoisomerase IV subunit A
MGHPTFFPSLVGAGRDISKDAATEEQTDSILRLQLGQLTRLNKGKLEDKKSDLKKSRSLF